MSCISDHRDVETDVLLQFPPPMFTKHIGDHALLKIVPDGEHGEG